MVLCNSTSAEAIDDTSFPITFAGSLIFTGATVGLLCAQAFHPVRSSGEAAVLTLMYIAVAAGVHTAAVLAMRRVFHEYVQARLHHLLWAIWIPVAWLPLLGVLTARNSAWVLAALPLLSVAATALLTQERTHPDEPLEREEAPHLRVLLPQETAFLRKLAPALAVAALSESGVAAVAADHEWTAGLLFALACVFPVWQLVARARRFGTVRVSIITSAAVVVLTWVALLPTLLAAQFGSLVGSGRIAHRASLAPSRLPRPSAGYSGVILLPPMTKTRLPPPPRPAMDNVLSSGRRQKPEVIPFDGQYWFYKAPAARPEPDARDRAGGSPQGERALHRLAPA